MNAKSPTTSWIYDLEIYPNCFMASFIPYGIPQDVINLYIAADIAKNVQDKKEILDAVGAKTFIIFRAWHEDEYERQNFTPASWDDSNNISSGIEGLYMFFKTHKIIIGYNSFNYDMTMLDIFIHYAPTFDWKTGLREDVHGIKEHITEFMFEHSQKLLIEIWVVKLIDVFLISIKVVDIFVLLLILIFKRFFILMLPLLHLKL